MRTTRTGPSLPLVQLLLLLLPLCTAALPHEPHQPHGPHQSQRTPSRPSRGSRIAIVGAGPSGLHMAYLLRSLGFHDLVIVEAASRVGGRSVTLQDEAEPSLVHEMGTCYLNSDYGDLRQMAASIGYQLEEVPLPEPVVHMSTTANDGDPVPLRTFVLDRVRRLDPGLGEGATDEVVARRIGESVARYLTIRSEFFPPSQPSYLEFSMTQPPAAALARLNCTVGQFLTENNLMALEPYFLFSMTAMGYGGVWDTSVMYGFMWMSPAFMGDLLAPNRNATGIAMLRRGFRTFWKASRDHLEATGGVRFRLGRRVQRVSRPVVGANPALGPVRLLLDDGSLEAADWLVWTPGVHRTAVSVFEDLSAAEAAAFAGLSSRKFRIRLVRLPGEPAVAANPLAVYLPVLDRPRHTLSQLQAVRNSAKILLPLRQSSTSTLVAYYMSDKGDASGNRYSRANVDCGVEEQDDLEGGEVLAEETFDYMPHHSVSDVAAGALWRILSSEVQGARRTWFAGHSVVFDSVKSVMKYNKMLVLAAFPKLVDRLAGL